MSCDERKDLLLLYAADALEADVRRELQDHLDSGCPRCAGGLVEAGVVLSHLPSALEPVEPPAAVRDLLMQRVARSVSAEADRRPRASAGWLRPALAATIAAVGTYIAVSVPMERGQQALEARLADQEMELRELQQSMRGAAERIRILAAPAIRVVSLQGTEAQPEARGRIFWDQGRAQWHFYASGMGSPGRGKTYQLWFITADQEKISAGTFDVDAHGEGVLDAAVPAGVVIALAAVTDEPEGGSAQPTGSIQMAGATSPAS